MIYRANNGEPRDVWPGGRRRLPAAVSATVAVAMLWLMASAVSHAQTLRGATTTGARPRVVLLWAADSLGLGVTGYNIYRRAIGETSFTLLNRTPISPLRDCAAFQAVIPRGSRWWTLLAGALPDSMPDGTVRPLADVCSITSFAERTDRWRRVQRIAAVSVDVAGVIGQYYVDSTAPAGVYVYRLMRTAGAGELTPTGANEDTIEVGRPAPIPTPSGVRVAAGDAMLQLLWDRPPAEFGFFNVYRSESAGGPFQRINEINISADISMAIDSSLMSPPAHGYTDYQRYDTATGRPAPRRVDGADIFGPFNDRMYYYRVAFVDLAGNIGPQSAPALGMPRDRTAPAVPQEAVVTAVESMNGFQIRWPNVRSDVHGHPERTASYRIYRYENAESPSRGATQVGGDIPQPSPRDSMMYLSYIDRSPGLRSECGDKTYYYRVEAVDESSNASARSIAQGAALRDTTPPVPPRNLSSDADERSIRLNWQPNADCDINAYLVYRSLCDYGGWVPCDTTGKKDQKQRTPGRPSECGGPFMLIGTVPHDEAVRRAGAGEPMFVDATLPAGSPLCYAYVVKAQDRSQNISGRMPIPDPVKEQIICQRLRDKTPPEPAVIAGLFARDGGIRVEYIGPPVQDIAAYHVYRAKTLDGPYDWVGGRTVVPPPATGALLSGRYRPSAPACGAIPLASEPYLGEGWVLDTVDPRVIYWYKVVGVDHDGNEAKLELAVPMSTFTFETAQSRPPSIVAAEAVEGPCAIRIAWSPGFDAGGMLGFVVFRSQAADGPYYQVGSVVRADSYTDNSVARNVSYWYRVAQLHLDGSMSALSTPREMIHP